MRSLVLISFLFSCYFSSAQKLDTIRHYDVNGGSKSFSTTSYPFQVARFDLDHPGAIHGFKIRASGSSGSSVRMHIFGHEAGTSFPQLETDLISPITIVLDSSGSNWQFIMLEDSILMDNNQFFIAFDNFNGVTVYSDNISHPISCESNSGGDYYYQFLRNGNDQWAASDNAFIIDVLYAFEDSLSERYFQDVTVAVGIPQDISNRTIAAADYNQDGHIDILVDGRLFRNKGDETYEEWTSQAGISAKSPKGNAILDMDNDGDMDLVFLDAQDTNWIYVNDGQGFFTEYWVGSIPDLKALSSFSFADLNGDNLPDLFISQLWSTYPEAEPNYLFYNDGFYGFTDMTSEIYPNWDGTWNYPGKAWVPAQGIIERNRNSRGSQFVDFDDDGDLDLYVTNYYLQQDEFYVNDNGIWVDVCRAKGIDVNTTGANHGTGVDWYDYDNDGDMDLLLSQFAHPGFQKQYDHRGTTIYSNSGAPNYSFTDTRTSHNIQFEETHAGCSFGDLNNDGLVDLVTTIYYGCRYMDVYEQLPDHSFDMQSYEYGVENITTGQDAVWLDFNNDGLLDLACGKNGKFCLFRNQNPHHGNYLEVDLIPTTTFMNAIGARVKVTVGANTYMQEVQAGRGQRMQKPFRLHFGLGNNSSVNDVSVKWPGDSVYTSHGSMSSDQIISINETHGSSTSVIEQELLPLVSKVIPNPYSRQANLMFRISKEDRINLRITNILGAIVFEDSRNWKEGTHNFEIPQRLANGLYFYSLKGKYSFGQSRFVKVGH